MKEELFELWGENTSLGLLDWLAKQMDCYLSDLRYPYYAIFIQEHLPAPNTFSLWEWNRTVGYLTNSDANFSDEAEARRFLIRFLEEWSYEENKENA